jgi:hypothetical protein
MKGVFTSTILFTAPSLINQSGLGSLNEDIEGEENQGGIIDAHHYFIISAIVVTMAIIFIDRVLSLELISCTH